MIFDHVEGASSIMDDIIKWGSTLEEHNLRLSEVLEATQESNLKLNKNKYVCGVQSLTFIGDVVSAEGMKPDPLKVRATKASKRPSVRKMFNDALSRAYESTETLHERSGEAEVDAYVDFVMHSIPVSDRKMDEIRRESGKDPDLQVLIETIVNEFPDTGCSSAVLEYWNIRDELSVVEGVILRNNRVVIPRSLRKKMLEKIHSGIWGVPKEVLSDDSPKFTSSEFRELAWNYDCKHTTSSPNSLQLNGLAEYHAVWLRHHCSCAECVSAATKQVLIEIDMLPLDIKVTDVIIAENGNDKVRIQWDDGHVGEFSSIFLRNSCYSELSLKQKKDATKPLLYKEETLLSVTYADCEADEQNVYRLLKYVNEHGVALIRDAPVKDDLLLEFLPKHIAPLVENSYGKIYDVMYMRDPTNLAYTRRKLQFHMDLVYYESVPGLLVHHCLKFDESLIGGENNFVDMFAVCEEFRETNPEEFKTLCTIPSPFSRDHFSRERPVHLLMKRPVIQLNHDEEIIGIYWNPSAAGVLEIAEDKVTDYYRAYQLFARAISNFHTKTEIRLKPGDILVFNNRRMVHNRKAFTAGNGDRHLKGCFIDISDYKSRLIHLSRKYGDMSTIKRVGNMDWL
ncbi:gamma-butyrobetaine dioxygenase-like [Ylistrum balloti]|uniref:gamma-butyrobetaine dioxygenase-like n=1 Tax=Ylistrum balloti TaxID=509963 RepID=UPI002905EBB3|nr:gamma-butyrobetaine dioxygenase-like [Ylistrum balloti]